MIKIYNKGTGVYLGDISQDDLQFLIDHLEEEHSEDQDYYLHRVTLDGPKSSGVSGPRTEPLESAMADSEDVEIRWEG